MGRVHFGLMFLFCVVTGEQMPAVASVLLTACGVANLAITRAWSASIPFFILLLCYTLLSAYIPAISRVPPQLVFGQ